MTCDASRPLRICFPIADRAREVGGSHISAMTLIQNLDRRRFDPRVILIGETGRVDWLARNAGESPERILPGLSSKPGLLSSVRIFREAIRLLSSGRFDVVHTNEGRMHALWGSAARVCGVAHVWHHRGNPDARGLRFLAPLTANQVISVSRFAAPYRSGYSAARRCTVIHSPFDLSIADTSRTEGRRRALAELGLTDEAMLVGFFGHFSDRKRPLKFIETIAAVRRADPAIPVHGLMFGEEHDRGLQNQMEQAIERLGLQGRIHLMGFRKPGETWLAGCDVLLVPAVEEPFGRTLIEAMLVGTPIVAAASGGNVEAIDDKRTGLLAPLDDPEALARALLSLLRDPALAQSIRLNARDHALASFGIETHVRGVEAIYDRINAGRRVR